MRAAVRDSDQWSILNLFPRNGIDPQLPSPSSGSRGPGEPLPFPFVRGGRLDGRRETERAGWKDVDTRNRSAQDPFNYFMRPSSLGRKLAPEPAWVPACAGTVMVDGEPAHDVLEC
jgi:hypothetical protein